MSKSEWVGVAAIAALGYILLKKLEPVTSAAQSATNTVTTYVEKVTDKVEKVSEATSILKDTAEKYYTPSGIAYNLGSQAGQDVSLSEADKAAANTVLDNADTANKYALALTPAVGVGVDAALSYVQGAVDAAQTGDKYTSSAGSSKVDKSLNTGTTPYAQPSAQEIKDYASSYNIITGEKKSSPSSSPVVTRPATVKARSGGYSAASESGTTKDAGKYATIKVKK